MKTTLILLFILIASIAKSQDWTETNIHNNWPEVKPYFVKGLIIGTGADLITYKTLMRTTSIKQPYCRMIAIAVNIGANILASSNKSKGWEVPAGAVASIGLTFAIRSDVRGQRIRFYRNNKRKYKLALK